MVYVTIRLEFALVRSHGQALTVRSVCIFCFKWVLVNMYNASKAMMLDLNEA